MPETILANGREVYFPCCRRRYGRLNQDLSRQEPNYCVIVLNGGFSEKGCLGRVHNVCREGRRAMALFRGGHNFFLLGFWGGLSRISPDVKEGIRGGGIKSNKIP